MKKRTFVFLTALLLALCMVTLVACGDKSSKANKGGGNNSQSGNSATIFRDGASIDEIVSRLESGEVKITSCKWEGYDIGNVKKPEYEIGFSNNKFIYHMKAYGLCESFFVCDFKTLSIGILSRIIDEKGQVLDDNGEKIVGTLTDESVGWGLIAEKEDDTERLISYLKEHGMSETDVAMRKINDVVISLIKEQKGLKEGSFSCKDNILIFDKDEIYSNEENGQTSISGSQNIKKMYEFNVPIQLPKTIENKIAEKLEEESGKDDDPQQGGTSLFRDGASIDEIVSKLESGEVKITSYKSVTPQSYKETKGTVQMGFVDDTFFQDYTSIRSTNEGIEYTAFFYQENGTLKGGMAYRTYVNYKWSDWEIAYLMDIDMDNIQESYVLDIMQSKTINECILLILQEVKKIDGGKFSFADNILNFEFPEEYDFGNSFVISINFEKMYDFNVPIELPKGLKEAIEAAKKEQAKQK